jgi:hydroxymethylglutaryl-CoA reductase (NADPH)
MATDHVEPDGVPGRGRYDERARRERLKWLRARTGAPLTSQEHIALEAGSLRGNLENFAGSVEVPVGLAGPLLFRGEAVRGSVVAPLATTEGALVASASRGARALTLAGGVSARVLSQRMTRAPAFVFGDLGTAARFSQWLVGRRAELEEQVRRVSRHARLVDVDPYQIGRHLHVRFVYETADAAGQNMTTAATWQIVRWLQDAPADVRPERTLLEGNLSSDKKVSAVSLIAGRGTRVTAEAVVPAAVVEAVLKTTPATIVQGHATAALGALQAGMTGSGINAANVIAGIFVATGQDVASVHESGVSILDLDLDGEDLLATLLLPCLVTGTVGGGTGLPCQRDWLAAMGCAGPGSAARFAEIVAGFALAMDVSTAAALASGQFAQAHQRLGRSRPVDWLTPGDLDAGFLSSVTGLRACAVDVGAPLRGDGITSELGALGEPRRTTGLMPLTVTWSDGGRTDAVAKVMPPGKEIVAGLARVASLCGQEVSQAWQRWGPYTEFATSHLREAAVYRRTEPELVALRPGCLGVAEDDVREAYVVLMERLPLTESPAWSRDDVDRALRAIGAVHRRWLGRADALDWLPPVPGPEHLAKTAELWQVLARYNASEQPQLLGPQRLRVVADLLETVDLWTQELQALPSTLVHNDFSPRNVAVLGERVVVYDWELARAGIPGRDVAELLAFTLGPHARRDDVDHHLAAHGAVDRRGYQLGLCELLTTRFQLYLAAHRHREVSFLPAVLDTAFHLWQLETEQEGC